MTTQELVIRQHYFFSKSYCDVFLVSDNSASNILIDFIGYNYFNDEMKNEF